LYGTTGLFLIVIGFILLQGSKSSRPTPKFQTGLASFYDEDFEQKRTASGKPFEPDQLVAAHPHYPLGTIVRVTNLGNGRSIKVKIIDRGPNQNNRSEGVIIDLSRSAAEKLGFTKDGRTRVRTQVVRFGPQIAKETRSLPEN